MGYKPTLGGLKKAQGFLSSKGYPMPILQMNSYSFGKLEDSKHVPVDVDTVSIDEMIETHGSMHEVVDVRITNKKGDKFIQFIDTAHLGERDGKDARGEGFDVIIESNKDDSGDAQFINFMNSDAISEFMFFARWGKLNLTKLEWLKFCCLPKLYADEVFAQQL